MKLLINMQMEHKYVDVSNDEVSLAHLPKGKNLGSASRGVSHNANLVSLRPHHPSQHRRKAIRLLIKEKMFEQRVSTQK